MIADKLFKMVAALLGCVSCSFEVADALVDTSAETLVAPHDVFTSIARGTSNGVGAVERFAECGPGEVLTGIGARVVAGNVTDLTIYCRGILNDGHLSDEESRYVDGGPSEEKRLKVDDNHVVVAVGAIVSHDNVARLVLGQCPWLTDMRRVDVARCSEKSTTPGSFTTEAQLDARSGASSKEKPSVVATGAGMTATHDNVYAVQLSMGYLK